MTTPPTTPYALFAHVPLSECRSLWQSWVRAENHDTDARERWRYAMEVRYGRRALAAVSNQLKLVTAERDQILDHLDGTIEQDKALINEYNDLRRQLKAVTAERDALRRELDAMRGEL